jgi:hypothetical protein
VVKNMVEPAVLRKAVVKHNVHMNAQAHNKLL